MTLIRADSLVVSSRQRVKFNEEAHMQRAPIADKNFNDKALKCILSV